MGKNPQNEYSFALIVDPGDQPVIVAVYVEYCPSTNDICMREVTPHLGQRIPIGSFGYPIPVH